MPRHRIVIMAVAGLAILTAGCSSSPSTTTTTVRSNSAAHAPAERTGEVAGALNINANWEASGNTVSGGTAFICSGTGDDAPLTGGSTVFISTVSGDRGSQTVRLPQGFTDDASNLSLPGKSVAGQSNPQICQFQIDVSGLELAPTYYLTVVSNNGTSTQSFSMARQVSGNQLPPEITVDPGTTSEPTTTTAPPGVVLKVSGTGGASTITILNGENESQQNDQSLPWTTTLTSAGSDVGLGAQSSDGSSSASITCEIDVPFEAPVAQTSTGPYAVVDCSASGG
jgi:hypothetical protein